MSRIATHTTDNVGSKVLLLWTVILSVTDLTTVLASLILVVTEGTVEGSKFTKLITLELVLAFWDRCSLTLVRLAVYGKCGLTYSFNDVMDQLLCLVDFLFGISHDQAMKILFLVAGMGGIGTAFSFLYGSFSTNGNFGL